MMSLQNWIDESREQIDNEFQKRFARGCFVAAYSVDGDRPAIDAQRLFSKLKDIDDIRAPRAFRVEYGQSKAKLPPEGSAFAEAKFVHETACMYWRVATDGRAFLIHDFSTGLGRDSGKRLHLSDPINYVSDCVNHAIVLSEALEVATPKVTLIVRWEGLTGRVFFFQREPRHSYCNAAAQQDSVEHGCRFNPSDEKEAFSTIVELGLPLYRAFGIEPSIDDLHSWINN